MTTAVAELERLDQQDQADAAERFAELLDGLAAGEPLDERKALKIIRAAGKTTDDVHAELTRRRRVAELRAKIAAVGDIAGRSRELHERESALKRELDDVTERLTEELGSVRKSLLALNGEAADADRWQKELAQLCPPPADEIERQRLLGTIRAMAARFEMQLQGRIDPAESRERIARLEQRLVELNREREQIGPLNVVNMFQVRGVNSRIADCQRQIDESKTRLEGDHKFVHQFKQLAALRARMAELECAAPHAA